MNNFTASLRLLYDHRKIPQHSSLTKRSLYDPEEEVCISYAEIDKAITDAKAKLGNFIPPELYELSSNNPKSQHISVAAEIAEEATRILASRFGLPKEIILFAIPKINTMKTKLKEMCPAFLMPVSAFPAVKVYKFSFE